MQSQERETLAACRLFSGLAPERFDEILALLDGQRRSYFQNALLLRPEGARGKIGILLEGRAHVLREEYSGTRTLLTELEPPDLFGEAFACAVSGPLPTDICVRAAGGCRVLWLAFRRLLSPHAGLEQYQAVLISNMLAVLAEKDLLLSRRIGHLSKRSTREKLLSYLFEQYQLCGSRSFTIPFDRQQLADYLCVDRSAMSSMLGRLRDDGLISFRRSHFTLTDRFLQGFEEEL
ncbi:MAG TPA: Crp/Fnr family transcriptional regulator [Candidatus Pygmaiobacter gallistercoris]|nr:Crp/Fnr family transcriptional regulator [Candidatus Pygmaiobacter gallistercoris]